MQAASPVVELGAGRVAVHDVEEESDEVSAVVGLFEDELRELPRGVVHGLIDAIGARVRGAAGAGVGGECACGVGIEPGVEPRRPELVGQTGVLDVSLDDGEEEADDESAVLGLLSDDAGDWGVDEGSRVVDAEVDELPCGFDPVVCPGVLDVRLHG